jgi:vancomycin resistance protein VanJ
VVCAALQGPYLVHRLTGSDAPADLRVATYNITNGTAVQGVADLVAARAPDLLMLQEVTVSAKAELQRELPEYRYTWFGPVLGASGGDQPDGDAVLSQYPITAVTPVDGLPPGARPTDVVTVAVGGRSVAALSVHLASPCIGCQVPDHINPAGSTSEAARIRDAEARRYAEVVSGLIAAGQPVVLAGDLNSSPLNRPVHLLTGAGLTDVHQAVGTSPGLTRGPGPGVARVDVVLVAGLVPLRDAEGHRDASTHSPVIADLAWPA